MALEVDFSKMDGRDALDIAIVIEDEAQLAYEHLAEWVAGDGNTEAAEFFSRMAVREKRLLLERAAREGHLVVFDHEPRFAACTVSREGRTFSVGEKVNAL